MSPMGNAWPRPTALAIVLVCAGLLLLAGAAGGLHADDITDRSITFALAAGALFGAALLALRKGAYAAEMLVAVVVGGIIFEITAGAGIESSWGIWALLAIAAGLSWAIKD